MVWVLTPSYRGAAVSDADAQTYLRAVEAADGQALEQGVQQAVNQFVIGCKADGIWSAIKASCILAGARTLTGALVPLIGASPTNNNFVSNDYNRKTGLVGNGSAKYLNSNRSNSADPQNSSHRSVYISSAQTNNAVFISTSTINASGDSYIYQDSNGNTNTAKLNNSGSPDVTIVAARALGLLAVNRMSASNFVHRHNGVSRTIGAISVSPLNESLLVFGSSGLHSNSRLAFYSIGEALDLALLDARVTTLINAIAAAVP